jgi:hypothetical protein
MPLMLPLPVPEAHAYISGPSGSRKSSAVLMTMLDAVIGAGPWPVLDTLGRQQKGFDGAPLEERGPEGPVLIFDHKGDPAMYHLAKSRADTYGVPFYLFSTEPGMHSDGFNPLANLPDFDVRIAYIEMLLAWLGLSYGEGYGRAFFTAMGEMLMLDANQPNDQLLRTLDSLVERVQRTFNQEVHSAAMHVIAGLRMAQACRSLSPAAGEREIKWRQVIAERAVVYCWLPLMTQSHRATSLLRMMLGSFIGTLRARNLRAPHDLRRANVFIDEAQVLAGMRVDILLQQARSSGVRMALANQSPADLNSHEDHHLSKKIETNTQLRIHLAAPLTEDRERLTGHSGEHVSYMDSWSEATLVDSEGNYSSSTTSSHREVVAARLNANDFLWVDNTPGLAWVHITPDLETTALGGVPTPVYIPFAVSMEEYADLSTRPMPFFEPRIRSELEDAKPQQLAADTRRYAQLEALYRKLSASETEESD